MRESDNAQHNEILEAISKGDFDRARILIRHGASYTPDQMETEQQK
ncbi:MAG: hypothetical protein Q4G69_09385 [Planctomycetia bacterium]|nr:hypothetical protein [Planctomycetia bacterium]